MVWALFMMLFVKKLKSLLTHRDKQFLLGLFFLSLIISIIETIGIAAIMPFMNVAMNFSVIDSNSYFSAIYTFFSFDSKISFIIAFGGVLILFYLFRSAANYFYFHMLARFSQGRYHLLAYRLFENYLGMRYEDFTKKNSSELTKTIVTEAQNLTQILSATLLLISEASIVVLIYIMMLYINYKITFALTLLLVLNAILMLKTISKRIKSAGKRRADLQTKFYETINRTFGNFKLIKLLRNDQDILKQFGTSSYGFAKANIANETYTHFPRLFLEALGFSIIIFIVTFIIWKYGNNASSALAMISMFTLALYRLMPSVNRILQSYNRILFYSKSLDIIHNDLMYDSENIGNHSISFQNTITIQNLSFSYSEDHVILNDVTLSINKGESVGIVGESGGGKSTLVDLIMGLYKPINGAIYIDDIKLDDKYIGDWRKKIGYIPQNVYLFDGSVGENIAFGHSYNTKRIDECLRMAQLFDYFQTYQGRETLIGENGVMLSGGQKQRIAIARALYCNPEILVMDEATSALDTQTEKEIMDSIYELGKNKTLIIIAHRTATLDRCDKIYEITHSKVLAYE